MSVPKKRRQVSFNIDEELYEQYKKVIRENARTPTTDLTLHIRKTVEKAKKLGNK